MRRGDDPTSPTRFLPLALVSRSVKRALLGGTEPAEAHTPTSGYTQCRWSWGEGRSTLPQTQGEGGGPAANVLLSC